MNDYAGMYFTGLGNVCGMIVGAMTTEQAREIRVPLEFLGQGRYRFTLYADGATPTEVVTTTGDISGGRLKGASSLSLKLASGGGSVIRITAAK